MEVTNLLILSTAILIFPIFWPLFFAIQKDKKDVNTTERILFFDYLKGLAIIAVIIIHVIKFTPDIFNNKKPYLDIINNLLRFAIPFFLIMSGILLNPKIKDGIKKFYNRKIIRLAIPYTLCVIAICLYNKTSFLEFIKLLITGQVATPYYFFIILFQFYLLYPFLIKIKDKKWFLLTTFLISLTCFLIPQTWDIIGIPFFGKYLFFFAYGISRRNYFLSDSYDSKNNKYWLILMIFYIGLVLLFPAKYYNTRLVYGIALFNIFFILKNKLNLKNNLNKLITKFGRNSLWIFLTHYLVVFTIIKNLKFTKNIFPYFIINIILSIFLSFILAYICQHLYSYVVKIIKKPLWQ